jgi:hypothetical protein
VMRGLFNGGKNYLGRAGGTQVSQVEGEGLKRYTYYYKYFSFLHLEAGHHSETRETPGTLSTRKKGCLA